MAGAALGLARLGSVAAFVSFESARRYDQRHRESHHAAAQGVVRYRELGATRRAAQPRGRADRWRSRDAARPSSGRPQSLPEIHLHFFQSRVRPALRKKKKMGRYYSLAVVIQKICNTHR